MAGPFSTRRSASGSPVVLAPGSLDYHPDALSLLARSRDRLRCDPHGQPLGGLPVEVRLSDSFRDRSAVLAVSSGHGGATGVPARLERPGSWFDELLQHSG